MVFSRDKHPGKLVVDSIHGDIHLTDREVKIIDTSSFQRLRQLKQLAMAQLVYPNATHTRFAHSIGALGVMIRVLRVSEDQGIELDLEQKENLRLAALLHDVGHYPYSHLMEKVDKVILTEEKIEGVSPSSKSVVASKSTYPKHTELGELIVTSQEDIMAALGGKERAQIVAGFFAQTKATDSQLSKLISSSLDLDRFDYLLRDSYATGVPYGHIDINYLLNNLQISPQNMVGVSEKALPAVEHFLLARFFMYRVVYYHKTTYGMEETCRQLLRRLRDRQGESYDVPMDGETVKDIVTSKNLSNFTDAFVDNIIRKSVHDENEVIRALARSILHRRSPKLLKEVSVCEERGEEYHAGKTFRQNCRNRLRNLAEEFKIPIEQFLLCETGPLTVGEQLKKYTAEEISELTPKQVSDRVSEEEEKDIKVFIDEDDEPRSMMNIEHSFVAKYANYYFQVFRLYVVYEGDDKEEVINRLQSKVKDWDKD